MTLAEAQSKVRWSRRAADSNAFLAILVGVSSAWSLVTGQQLLPPLWGLAGLAAGILSGLAYRAARRWQDYVHDLERAGHG